MKTLGINLLLADDDDDDRFFFKEVIDEIELNIALTTVENGEQLIQLLNNNGIPLPDLLFLDLNMPLKNGVECLTELRQKTKLKKLPVVVYSTSFNPEVADELYHLGANHYFRKPHDFNDLKKGIHTAIDLTINNKIPPQNSKEKYIINS